MSNHTPGPWKYNNFLVTDHLGIWLAAVNSHNKIRTPAENDSNGHLIAAAPEMLQALKLIAVTTTDSAIKDLALVNIILAEKMDQP